LSTPPPPAKRSREELRRKVPVIFAAVLLLAVIAAIALAGWQFRAAGTTAFDRATLQLLRHRGDPDSPLGPAWLKQTFVDVTALGSTAVLTLVSLLVLGYLAAAGRARQALALVAVLGGGAALGKVLKLAIARPRPDLVTHVVDVHTASFPSGHAVDSTIVYLTLGCLLSASQASASLARFVLFASFLLVSLIGFSRLYLGVHYPSDVLAGWALGGAWVFFCRAAAQRMGAPLPRDRLV
jgi:undecaprenyl-diphosphatase